MARLISSTELQQRILNEQELVVIDIHESAHYQREHIPGSVNIPLAELANNAVNQFSKSTHLVVYGSSHGHEASHKAAQILEELGFEKVSDFDGGLAAWKRAGFVTEGEDTKPVGEHPIAS